MEESESEAVFNSLGINPQRFINEVLNSSDELLDGAFAFALQQATAIAGDNKSEELSKGVSFLHHLTQTTLDKRLEMWEKYCLRHCFSVPEGFVLPNDQDSLSNVVLVEDGLSDAELDSKLESLRAKLSLVGKESVELQEQILALEKELTLKGSYNASIAEIMQQYGNNAVTQISQELGKSAAKLLTAFETFKMKRKNEQLIGKIRKISDPCKRQNVGNSWSIEDIQEAASILRNTY